jgi:hypothetical protein
MSDFEWFLSILLIVLLPALFVTLWSVVQLEARIARLERWRKRTLGVEHE